METRKLNCPVIKICASRTDSWMMRLSYWDQIEFHGSWNREDVLQLCPYMANCPYMGTQ